MALDSLASWLVEGSPSIEAELASPSPAAQIKAIFQAQATHSDLEGVAHMLDALIKMLKHSPKITVSLCCCRGMSAVKQLQQAVRDPPCPGEVSLDGLLSLLGIGTMAAHCMLLSGHMQSRHSSALMFAAG